MSPDSDREPSAERGEGVADDRAELDALASDLGSNRPVPPPALRSRLRAAIHAAGNVRARPPHLRRRIAIYELSGAVLLAVAALGLAGAGPFAP